MSDVGWVATSNFSRTWGKNEENFFSLIEEIFEFATSSLFLHPTLSNVSDFLIKISTHSIYIHKKESSLSRWKVKYEQRNVWIWWRLAVEWRWIGKFPCGKFSSRGKVWACWEKDGKLTIFPSPKITHLSALQQRLHIHHDHRREYDTGALSQGEKEKKM